MIDGNLAMNSHFENMSERDAIDSGNLKSPDELHEDSINELGDDLIINKTTQKPTLTEIRNKLYDAMPTGEVYAYRVVQIIYEHLDDLDNYINLIEKEAENYIQSLPEEIWRNPSVTNIKEGFAAGLGLLEIKK